MQILGIEKSSFIDYPDKITTVVFTGGCNFQCPYCHNGQLVKGKGAPIDLEEILTFLRKRKKYVDALCITGGEPTLQGDLKEFIKAVKAEDFFVKLDTNGSQPELIKDLIAAKLIDYIAMDVKAPLDQYPRVTGVECKVEAIQESIQLLQHSSVEYEFRTTVGKGILSREEILRLAQQIKGSKAYYLQNFRDGDGILGGKGCFTPYEANELQGIVKEIEDLFQICKIRG